MTKVPKDMKINIIFKAISEVEPKVFNMLAADGLNILEYKSLEVWLRVTDDELNHRTIYFEV